MKTPIKTLLAALLVAGATAASAQSLSAKLEPLGEMQYVRVAGLKQVVRDGRLLLQIDFQNDDHERRTVAWRVRWLDDAGIQVWDDEAWKPELLHGRQRRLVQAVAPTPKASDFRVELHSPDNSGAAPAPQPGN